jgi:TonB-dependent SusC/RagA subfamily outer membrane receptor
MIMKAFFLPLLTTAMLALTFASCSTTSMGSSNSGPNYSNLQSLDQVLRMQPGLRVEGGGSNAKVYVRGISTITLNTQPLFIIDNVPIGTSYAMANNAVNVQDITSVSVLSGKSETTIYGEQGNNGVIIIKTVRSRNIDE